jgi:RNA polymerase sigma factor for flagellar operon FliA
MRKTPASGTESYRMLDTMSGAAETVGVAVMNGGQALPPELVTEMNTVIRGIAGRLHARLPRSCGIDIGDLIQAGNIGLIQALRGFEPGHGAPLGGYARFRIRGEMLDMIRRSSGRGNFVAGGIVAWVPGATLKEPGWECRILAPEDSSPQRSALSRQRVQIIGEEMKRLPPRDRMVVRLRYASEMTLRQIGAVLRVNESRACQIHQNALIRLKRALSNRGVRSLAHL